MEFTTWLSLTTLCALGAMSPGPSAAIIIQISTQAGRWQGIIASLGHGAGIGCYALLAATGLAVVIEQSPLLFEGLKLLGAAFLAFIGLKALNINIPLPKLFLRKKNLSNNNEQTPNENLVNDSPAKTTKNSSHFMIGFLTAFLNPKVALFFLALFSQFVSTGAGITEKFIMGTTALSVDALWYCLVAIVVSNATVGAKMARYSLVLQKIFGVLLILLAIRIVVNP